MLVEVSAQEEGRALERAERLEVVRDAALALRGLEGRAEARELTYNLDLFETSGQELVKP